MSDWNLTPALHVKVLPSLWTGFHDLPAQRNTWRLNSIVAESNLSALKNKRDNTLVWKTQWLTSLHCELFYWHSLTLFFIGFLFPWVRIKKKVEKNPKETLKALFALSLNYICFLWRGLPSVIFMECQPRADTRTKEKKTYDNRPLLSFIVPITFTYYYHHDTSQKAIVSLL